MHILYESVDEVTGDRVAAFLFESRFSSELDPGSAFCLGPSQSETFKIISAQLDV